MPHSGKLHCVSRTVANASERASVPSGVCFVQVANSRKAVALAADAFYGHPSGKLTLVGITGTNGKTTTVTLLYNLFRNLGYSCGLLSTIANYVDGQRLETENTTVDPITLNSLLARMVEAGCEYCFMEVSSIGVEQDRVTGLQFAMGIFSNLTHDHLDYHKTFAEYLRCKKLFFDQLPKDAIALINADDRNGSVMVQNTRAQVVTYSVQGLADHTARVLEQNFDGMLLKIDGTDTWCRLIGRHNAYNLLAIYSTAVCLGANPTETLVALSRLESAPGRLENLRGPKGLSVIVDYAHTPDALQNVLTTLRDIAPERTLVCLFGCGGDRDKTKRPEMAQVAAKLADRLVITSDNPRTEDPEAIIGDIKAGLDGKGLAKSLVVTDRREAIRTAILTAPRESTILLAGKGVFASGYLQVPPAQAVEILPNHPGDIDVVRLALRNAPLVDDGTGTGTAVCGSKVKRGSEFLLPVLPYKNVNSPYVTQLLQDAHNNYLLQKKRRR